MKIEKVRDVLRAQPFRPFWVHLADGGRIPVEHEDFVVPGPTGREMIVFLPDDSHQIVDVLLITRIEITPAHGTQARKKR